MIRRVFRGSTGAELNPVLADTGKLLLLYAVLFAITWPRVGFLCSL